MANDYFNHSANRIPRGSLAIADQVNDIADEIAVGLDKLPTEEELKQGKLNYSTDTGAADAYVVTLSYTPTLTAGLAVSFQAANDNTGPSTLNLNALGARSILNNAGSALVAGQITAGQILELRYDGTAFRIMATDVPAVGIKTIYESNADTNAFTDAEQTKVGHLTVTGAVDLDAMNTKLAGIENGATADQAWGEIGGTLSNQSDLQTALDGKSATTHNHDATYSALGHNHDATYSQLGHNHDSSYLAIGGGSTMTGNNTVNDGWAWYFGTGQDMSIYHTSDQSFVRNTTGALTIENTGGAINIDVEVNDGTGYLKAFDTVGNPHTCLSWGNGSGDEPSLFFYYDNTVVARTDTIANGGILVNSLPVLTKKTESTNHHRAGSIQLTDGSNQAYTIFDVDSLVTEGVSESVGPTGSGADNTWSALDNIPTTATAIIVDLNMLLTTSGSGAASYNVYAAVEGVTLTANSSAQIGYLQLNAGAASRQVGHQVRVIIPVDGDGIFQLRWVGSGNTSDNINLHYRGYITD